jgi:hypothetical protein
MYIISMGPYRLNDCTDPFFIDFIYRLLFILPILIPVNNIVYIDKCFCFACMHKSLLQDCIAFISLCYNIVLPVLISVTRM